MAKPFPEAPPAPPRSLAAALVPSSLGAPAGSRWRRSAPGCWACASVAACAASTRVRKAVNCAQNCSRCTRSGTCPGRLAHPPANARDRALDTTRGYMRFTR